MTIISGLTDTLRRGADEVLTLANETQVVASCNSPTIPLQAGADLMRVEIQPMDAGPFN